MAEQINEQEAAKTAAVEDYVKRMVNEVIELEEKINKLNDFIIKSVDDIDKVEFGHMMVQLAGMVQYRNGLISRLQMRNITIQNGKAYQTTTSELNTNSPVEKVVQE